MNNKAKQTLPFPVIILTAVVSFFCVIKTVNAYLVAGTEDDGVGGPLAVLYALTILIAFGLGILFKKKVFSNISKDLLFIVFWILFFYLITITFIGKPYTSFAFLFVFTIAALLMPSLTCVDGRLFMKCMMLYPVPAILKLDEIFVLPSLFSTTISMGTSYAFLTPVIVTIVYLSTYFKEESLAQKSVTILLSAINFVFASYLLLFGSRGPVLAIIATIVFLLVVRPDETGVGLSFKKRNFFITLVIAIIASLMFVTLLNVFQKEFEHFGLSFNFIDKFLRLNDESDMTNGRTDLYKMAIGDFIDSPVWGKGFDLFGSIHPSTDANYPHNFILQILADGGILLLIVFGVPIIRGIVKICKSCSKDEYAVFTTLLLGSVPGAMFTGDLWRNITLWLFFGMVLSKNFVSKRLITN